MHFGTSLTVSVIILLLIIVTTVIITNYYSHITKYITLTDELMTTENVYSTLVVYHIRNSYVRTITSSSQSRPGGSASFTSVSPSLLLLRQLYVCTCVCGLATCLGAPYCYEILYWFQAALFHLQILSLSSTRLPLGGTRPRPCES